MFLNVILCRVRDTGNVGIGTDSARKRLHIKCANGSGIGFGNFTGSDTSPALYFSGSDSHMTNLDEPHIWSEYPDDNDHLSFLCKGRHIWYNQSAVNHNGTKSERMTLLANGNLGIGTDSPLRLLHVEGDSLVEGNQHIGHIANSADANSITRYLYFDYIDENGYYANRRGGGIVFRGNENSNFDSVGYNGTVWQNYCAIYGQLGTAGNGSLAGDLIFETRDGGTGAGNGNQLEERMRITHDGNVGIGTTSPECTLDVNGDIKIRAADTSNSQKGIYFREGADYTGTGAKPYNCSILTYAHTGFSDGLSINGYDGVSICTGKDTRQERMRVDLNGKVGIGTQSPEGLLHICRTPQESGLHKVLYLESNTNGGSPNHNHGPQIMFQTKWQSGNIWRTAAIAGTVYNSNGGGALKFYTAPQGGAGNDGYSSNLPEERMLIDRDGKVGIGSMTAVPTQFYVYKSGSQEPLCRFESGGDCSIRVEGSGGEVYLEIANTSAGGSTTDSWGIGTNDDKHLHFAYGTNSTMNKTEKVIILDNGRVGIGTTSPRAGIEVVTTAGTNGNAGVDDNSVSYLSYYGSSDAYSYDFNSNNYVVSIIGKGLVYAEKYVGASDERIKKNIVEVNDQQALKK